MEGTQGELFNPGEHEHVYQLTQGPYVTEKVITTLDGGKWCWTCQSWVNEYRDGRWLNWRERDREGYTWRDLKR